MNKKTILNSLSCYFIAVFCIEFSSFFVDGRLGKFSRKSDDLSETGLIYGEFIWLSLLHLYSQRTFKYYVIPKLYEFPRIYPGDSTETTHFSDQFSPP
jgi:hypothetical protein